MIQHFRHKLLAVAILILTATSFAQAEGEAHKEEKFDIGGMIMHHISDAHEWEFAHGLAIPLPVIIYTADRGVEIMSSSHFYHSPVDGHKDTYKHGDYVLEHEHIHRVAANGEKDEAVKVWDFSITKNVASMLLSAVLLFVIFMSVAKGYATNKGKAPKGIQSFLEPIIVYIRDEVVKPSIGPDYQKYLPYMLTLFFFIWINNLLGLLPGGANLTGNIAITLVLAVITFFVVHANANKHYFMHLVKPTGVPLAILPLIIPVEIVGVFMKPFSLMLRLFANITAGHIIILSLLGLIFIAKASSGAGMGVAVSPLIVAFSLFMNLIELLVAFLQAFIFTLLSSMYIGSAIENNHDADHGH